MNSSLLSQYSAQFNINNRLLDLVFSSESCTVTAADNPLVHEDAHHKALQIELPLSMPDPLPQNIIFKKMFHRADYDAIRSVFVAPNPRTLNTDSCPESIVDIHDIDLSNAKILAALKQVKFTKELELTIFIHCLLLVALMS
ncbi:hypothetical protein ACJJTC_007533 [Scirpophaga incertulas]